MEITVWHLWIIGALALLTAEIFFSLFVAASFALGCVFAAAAAYVGAQFEYQLIAFSIGTLVAFFGIRPFMRKFAYNKHPRVLTNVDALIGQTGFVTVAVDNAKNEGRASVGGDDWRAESEHNVFIDAGRKIQVTNVSSTKLTVKPSVEKL